MPIKRIDLSLILLGLVLIFISSYFLFGNLNQEATQLPSIAKLNFTDATVKTKKSQSLNWNDAEAGINLFSEQMIYTYSGATAIIKFNHGHEVEVEENSLLKIQSGLAIPGESISVEKGYLKAKITKGSPLQFNIKGKNLLLEGDDANVLLNIGKENIDVGILQGNVKVTKDKEAVMINNEKSLTVMASGEMRAKENIAIPEFPTIGKKIYTSNPSAHVNFSWKTKLSMLQIEISSDPQFQHSLIQETVEATYFSTALKPGTYFWRLTSPEGKSVTSSFAVLTEKPPVILEPLDGDVLVFNESKIKEKTTVDFRWKDPGQKFLVEVEEEGILSAHQVQKNYFQFKVTKSGAIKWRVKNLAEDRPEALFSEWQKIQFKVLPPLPIPEIISPVLADIEIYSEPIEQVQFKWKQAPDTEAVIEILENNKIVHTQKGMVNGEYLWSPSKIGQFKWRVSQYDREGQQSVFSQLGTLNLMDLRDATLDEGVYRVQLKRPDQKVKFDWDNESKETVHFELAEDKKFSIIVHKITDKKSEAEVNVAKLGTYYWRSRIETTTGSKRFSKPKKVIIEPIPAPLKPQKLPDLEVPLEWKTKSKTQGSWWRKLSNLFISEAYAEEFISQLKIEIPPQENIKFYFIEIYADQEMKKLVLQKKMEAHFFEWENAVPGQYFWRYAVIDFFERQSPFSDLSHLKVLESAQPKPSLQKALLKYPIRKEIIAAELNSIKFQWSEVSPMEKYQIEISTDEEFKNEIFQAEVTTNELEVDKKILPANVLLFWRVQVFNQKDSKLSNTGRFLCAPSPELAAETPDQPKIDLLKIKRAELLWMPSLDTYTFKQGTIDGDIKGHVLNSAMGRLQIPFSWVTFELQLFRQSGKVFSSEKYLYQTIDGKLLKTWHDTFFYGLALQMVSAQTYKIESAQVKSASLSGLNYGPVVGLTFDIKNLKNQLEVEYLLGTIPTMDASLRTYLFNNEKKYYAFELGYSARDYKKDSYTGSQNSIRIGAGLGFSF